MLGLITTPRGGHGRKLPGPRYRFAPSCVTRRQSIRNGEMIVRLIGFMAFLIASVSAVAAAEVCVACAGPDVTYRCTVEKSEKIEQMPDAQRVLEQVCTKILV